MGLTLLLQAAELGDEGPQGLHLRLELVPLRLGQGELGVGGVVDEPQDPEDHEGEEEGEEAPPARLHPAPEVFGEKVQPNQGAPPPQRQAQGYGELRPDLLELLRLKALGVHRHRLPGVDGLKVHPQGVGEEEASPLSLLPPPRR